MYFLGTQSQVIIFPRHQLKLNRIIPVSYTHLQSYLYSEVYEHFTRKFTTANVIFLDAEDGDKDKVDFIYVSRLKKENPLHLLAEGMLSMLCKMHNLTFVKFL